MPLPTPLPQTLGNKSLLFHPRVAEEAQRLLSMNDDNLIPQLIQSLSMTTSKHMYVHGLRHGPFFAYIVTLFFTFLQSFKGSVQ